jgi:dUTP pyrophosphatase
MACRPGEKFHMDMGFVCGTKYSHKDEDGRLITSLDGYNSYLLIIDRATRYLWVFLSKFKTPKIDIVKDFLKKHGAKESHHKVIRTDEGGELRGSHSFQQAVREEGYILEQTASDSSFQNEMAERPNRTLGDIMRALLHGSNLGPEYWSWAVLHAVYLCNRLPHKTTNMTPMQAYTGVRPNLNKLRVFGSPVVARLPGKRIANLDPNTATGVFLGYTATDSKIYYQDYTTKKIKVATHVSFDEAGYTNHPMKLTLLQQQLQTNEPCSMANPDIKDYDIVIHTDPTGVPLSGGAESNTLVTGTDCCLQVHKLSDRATIPTKGTAEAAGYDLCSAVDIEIMPHTVTKVPTNIAVQPPQGTYCQIWSRSGLVTKHGIAVQAGIIDRDYTGDVTMVLYNHSSAPYMVQQGHKIAQLVIHKLHSLLYVRQATYQRRIGVTMALVVQI